jgi:hypothetical protein
LVGAGHHTVTAPHAFGIIDPDNAIFTLLRGPGGADLDAFRVGALVAANGKYKLGHMRVFSFFSNQYPVPEDIWGEKMLCLAGENAGVAADTSFKFYRHSPSHRAYLLAPSNSYLRSAL